MRVFVTGATGFIGSHIVPELIGAGHRVLGLTRSDAGAEQLKNAGAEVHRGDLEDPETLRIGAEQADGVIHCAFDHNFANFAANCEKDMRNIEAMGNALAGTNKPLVITSGVGMGNTGPGKPATEDVFDAANPHPRKMSELAGQSVAAKGVNVSVVRLPQVHDTRKQGLITSLVPLAREKGFAAYVGEGSNRWAAAPVADVARLYLLALERAQAGSVYNAVAEEGVAAKDIAEALGRGLSLPVKSVSGDEAAAYFGWMMMFASLDLIASSAQTRKVLGWEPTGRTLLQDLAAMDYSAA